MPVGECCPGGVAEGECREGENGERGESEQKTLYSFLPNTVTMPGEPTTPTPFVNG
jgi:hypothetical protein